MLDFLIILVVQIETKHFYMLRYSVKDIVGLPQDCSPAIYNDQVAVMDTQIFGFDIAKQLFSIDAFAIGYRIIACVCCYLTPTPTTCQYILITW